MTAAAPPLPSEAASQLAENGRVLATLDDWRAIMFVLVGVIVILIVLLVWMMIINTRRDARIASSNEKVAGALTDLTVEIRSMRGFARQRLSHGKST